MRRVAVLAAVGAAAVLAYGCETEGVSGCVEPPQTALDQLDVKLTDPVAVEAETFSNKAPPDLQGDVHYVAGISPDGDQLIWIFGERAYDDQGGTIIAADGPTRQASKVGEDLNPQDFDLGPGDDDYSNIRDCFD